MFRSHKSAGTLPWFGKERSSGLPAPLLYLTHHSHFCIRIKAILADGPLHHPLLQISLFTVLSAGHLGHPWGHLGSFGCVSHVRVASRGLLLKMNWRQVLVWKQQGQRSSAWEIPKYQVNVPGVAFPTFDPAMPGFLSRRGEHASVCFLFHSAHFPSKFVEGTGWRNIPGLFVSLGN